MLWEGFTARVGNSDAWSVALDTGSVTLAAGPNASIPLGPHGAVIGEVFRKHDGSRVTRFSSEEAAHIAAGDFRELIDRYWGPYLAIVHDADTPEIRVLRAPLGELPCLVVPVGEAFAIASDVDMLSAFGLYDPLVDWSELARELARKDRVSTATCLWSVRELRGGTMEAFGPRGRRAATVWSPSQACAAPRIDHIEDAIALVADQTRMCIGSRTSGLKRTVLMLSGGVDSSILAAALVGAGVHVEAMTLVTRDALGDERDYARAVCDHLGIILHERQREVDEIDINWSSAAGLPRPSGRFMWQESLRHSHGLARETDAGAILNGGGGDQVFCSLHSSNPVADALRTFGPGKTAWRMAGILSEITEVPVATIIADGVRRAWLGKRSSGTPCDISMLCGSLTDPENDGPRPRPGKLLPGQEAHARMIGAGQSYVETLDPRSAPQVIAPLLSQPLVEACLRIPSWLWFGGGLNRYAARQAFALDLPKHVIFRHSKGTPDSFTAEIFETWRPQIRELLADGELARQGVIDRAAVLEVLDDPRPPRDSRFRRVLQFAEAEAWAASWA
ncbi:asparagine synthase-related protein [Novosphingobium sp. TCA1]|uniref:asparagine synthase-related protein n=1 Tax=Novosphingobium sp. TCA1 TaxID=2682474 RepID=UPI00135ABF97|nr:asparagine synthase-related protein [Novosphingobium sp. TCA1]